MAQPNSMLVEEGQGFAITIKRRRRDPSRTSKDLMRIMDRTEKRAKSKNLSKERHLTGRFSPRMGLQIVAPMEPPNIAWS